jgi:osomolarity two-component system phosphorelay intermediate protein YPD1
MMPATEEKKADDESSSPPGMLDFGGHVDDSAFEQILEMDEGDADREFSSGLVIDFFEQAERTFTAMETALKKGNLDDLGSLGHFLKGSSATLGFIKIRDNCETIQKYGKSPEKREADDPKITEEARLKILTTALEDASRTRRNSKLR